MRGRWRCRCSSTLLALLSLLLLLATALIVHSWTPSAHKVAKLDQLARRQRRRARLLTFQRFQQPQENENDITEQNNNVHQLLDVKDAPYYMTYPRYRIYLSASNKRDDNKHDNNHDSNKSTTTNPFSFLSFPKLFFSDLGKMQLEQEFGSDDRRHVVWIENKNGLDAFAALWRQSAALHEKAVVASLVDDHQHHHRDDFSVVVALPDCSQRVVRHWTEILNWMKEQQHVWKDESNIIMPVLIDAELLADRNIPVVQLTARRVASDYSRQPHYPRSTAKTVQDDPTIIESRLKSWVNRILVSQGICPFTKSVTKSGQGLSDVGVPVARIVYQSSHASVHQIYQLMADTWEAIADMIAAGPTGKAGVSSILFAAPAFDQDFALWAGPIFAMLEASVVAIGAERSIGVVCFHPCYATPDGSSWPGFGHMHSVPRLQQWYEQHTGRNISKEDAAAGGAWQRRTPHATINVLRADQLAAAEGRRATGILYAENIQKLVDQIGTEQLADDLNRERKLTS